MSSSWITAQPKTIRMTQVVTPRDPFQIRSAIVQLVPVLVIDFHAACSRPYECFRNHHVNRSHCMLLTPILVQ